MRGSIPVSVMRRIGSSVAVRAYEDVWLNSCANKTKIQTLFADGGEGFSFGVSVSVEICEKIVQK